MNNNRQKGIVKSFFWLISLALIGFCLWMVAFVYYPLPMSQKAVTLHIPQGTSVKSIAQELQRQQIINEPWRFMLLVKLTEQGKLLQAGDYELIAPLRADELINILKRGSFMPIKVQFIEGTSFAKVREKLAQFPKLKQSIFNMTDEEVMLAVSGEAKSPEGWFYPDTYFAIPNTSDIAMLKRAYQKMQIFLADEWQNRDSQIPFQEPYQALILASIIEKETTYVPEQATIAGVFVNRLKLGMKLQTDPTVIYGMGNEYQGNIRRADLERDTPYNTYTRHGLPPTPIAIPSGSAIHAALHPQTTDALYFVANGEGQHVFSSNLEAHNHAVNQYHLKRQSVRLK